MRYAILLLLAATAPAAAQQVASPPAAAAAATTPQPALPGGPRTLKVNGPGLVSRNAPVNGILTLYGNERCPTDSAGNEVVVCVRRNAAEQYRVPKELREFQITPENESWAVKAQGGLNGGVGVDSVASCTSVGAAGAGGCEVAASRANKRYWDAKKAADARIP